MAARMSAKKPVLKMPWNDVKNRLYGLVFAFMLMAFLLYFQGRFAPAPDNLTSFPELAVRTRAPGAIVFRDADVIFHRSTGELSDRIEKVTGSPLTHCGMIVIDNGTVLVLEAADKVSMTPVEAWIRRGKDKKFALLREPELNEEQQKKILAAGKQFLGRPYDFQYELDDEKLYCSELVYKAYKQGIGVELGILIPLKSLNYQGEEDFIRSLMKGELPLERPVIPPAALYADRKLKKMYDDFKL